MTNAPRCPRQPGLRAPGQGFLHLHRRRGFSGQRRSLHALTEGVLSHGCFLLRSRWFPLVLSLPGWLPCGIKVSCLPCGLLPRTGGTARGVEGPGTPSPPLLHPCPDPTGQAELAVPSSSSFVETLLLGCDGDDFLPEQAGILTGGFWAGTASLWA